VNRADAKLSVFEQGRWLLSSDIDVVGHVELDELSLRQTVGGQLRFSGKLPRTVAA